MCSRREGGAWGVDGGGVGRCNRATPAARGPVLDVDAGVSEFVHTVAVKRAVSMFQSGGGGVAEAPVERGGWGWGVDQSCRSCVMCDVC
jgi:hypothetical protein